LGVQVLSPLPKRLNVVWSGVFFILSTTIHSPSPDFQARFEEAQKPYYADCKILTDTDFVDVVRGMLTEYAVEMGLSEQQLRRSTGFIIGILSRS
jgi:hypothetical protein